MLGWFKKKFGKKPAEPEAVEPEAVASEPMLEATEEVVVHAVVPEPAVLEPIVEEPIIEQSAVPPIVVEEEAPVAATTEPAVLAVPDDVVEPEPAVSPDEEIVVEMVAAAMEGGEPSVVEESVPEPVVLPADLEMVPEVEAAEEQPESIDLAPTVAEIEVVEADSALAEEREPAPEAVVAAVIEEPQSPATESPAASAVEMPEEAAFEGEPEADVSTIEEERATDRESETAAVAQEAMPPETMGEHDEATEQADTAVEPEPASVEPIVPAAPLVGRTQQKPANKSLFKRLQERLGKTRDAFIYRLDSLFLGKKEIDQDLFEQLEEILITADLGVATTLELIDGARKKVKRDQLSDPQALKAIIRDQILAYIEASEQPAELVMPEEGPFVIMVVGVNGVGKTTTIGKIAAKFVRAGQSVLLVAGDTFRAAAINQLRIWGERVGVEVIAQKPGADPSSVVFDGLEYGTSHNYDVILIDTAGRLHTSVNLMEELKKIKRVIGKKLPGAPHEVMLVLDATTGQNGISQAKLFHEAVGVTGLTLTKLDGTAKGGIVANVCRETKTPVRFIGIGEQIDDLRDFDAREFVEALFAGRAEG